MRLLGTLLEWIEHNPEAYLTNRKFLQKGVSINVSKLEKPTKFKYPTRLNNIQLQYEDTENLHSTPLIYFGNQAPYIVSGFFEYQCSVIFWASGAGGTFPVSNEMLRDPNWEEYDVQHYEKGL